MSNRCHQVLLEAGHLLALLGSSAGLMETCEVGDLIYGAFTHLRILARFVCFASCFRTRTLETLGARQRTSLGRKLRLQARDRIKRFFQLVYEAGVPKQPRDGSGEGMR